MARLQSGERPEHETINEFFKNDSKNILLHYALASALERTGQLGSAVKIFEQVASNRKNYHHIQANAWFRLGRLTSGNKRRKSLKNCLALTSDHREAKKLLSEMENVTTA